ncbi:Putative beta-barrel porin-2, OmpL-like. bbp2 [Dyadobacter koreensis]|uniref:Putative beta-barrel porin-2, OmpL-like. bbp2 n=2 Tax=Dyadobacter koreensis TaxID=408657 RepID=A0A1H6Z0D0_9BACT|nr:Putative beta-barrel porin-2, OmpL-like. bbp2 [Dyadobacter koreensis]
MHYSTLFNLKISTKNQESSTLISITMNKLLLFAAGIFSIPAIAQDTISIEKAKPNPLTFSGYVEAFYSYDFNKPANHERPGFLYNFNKHNEVNLNLGLFKVNYNTVNVRANLAVMAGTYPQYNLAAEQGLLKNIFEANVGFKISKKNNLWIDAGIMPSHIGFESAIGKDNWNLTRSILAENSPYYEAGVKIGYTSKNEKLYAAAMYLNGWQRIQKIPGNQTPAFGTQLTYKPSANATLNWSTYIGNEQPDSTKQWRYFNNIYGQFQLTDKFGLTAGFDIGMQQKSKGSSSYNVWYTPVLIARYMPNEKVRIAARGEYYADEKGVIISTGTPNGFKTFGYSANFDYLPAQNVMFRLEARAFNSKDDIFTKDGRADNQNFFVTTSVALSF